MAIREQIHRDDDLIAEATRQHKRLQPLIAQYQENRALPPDLEAQYTLLSIEYGSASKNYEDLLEKKQTADLTANIPPATFTELRPAQG